ncbi:MAG: hypothetical protein H0T13_07035 [Actinobacteria bacterium]|nr:hypothetical protein [Actinomycetota bacterium]
MADAIAPIHAPEPSLAPSSEDAAVAGAAPTRPPLGELLKSNGFVTDEQLEEALDEGAQRGTRLGEIVVARGWASEDDVAKLLAQQWDLGYVDRASIWFDGDALTRMSREQAQLLEALPTRVEDGRVVVAVAEPTEERLASLRAVIGDDTVVVVVPKTALDAGLRSDLLSDERESPVKKTEKPPAASFEDVPSFEDEPAPMPASDRYAAPPVLTKPTLAPRAESTEELPLGQLLDQLRVAASEAATLQHRAGALALCLDQIALDLAAAEDRLVAGRQDQQAEVERLKEQVGHRTELTEQLKTQLHAFSRTLDSLD